MPFWTWLPKWNRRKLILFCLAGFCADALTTWWGITHVPSMAEANPFPAHMIATRGLSQTLLVITVVKLVAVLAFLGAENILRSFKGFGRTQEIVTAGIVSLCFVGWVPAINNLIGAVHAMV